MTEDWTASFGLWNGSHRTFPKNLQGYQGLPVVTKSPAPAMPSTVMYRVGPPLWEVQSGRPPNFSDDLAKIIWKLTFFLHLSLGMKDNQIGCGSPNASVQHCLMPPSMHAIHPMLKNALGDRLRDKNAPILVRPKADHGRQLSAGRFGSTGTAGTVLNVLILCTYVTYHISISCFAGPSIWGQVLTSLRH